MDVSQEISAVSRRVGARTLPAGEARVSTVGRTYDTTVEDMWDVCTDPDRIRRWFLPVTGDLRVGGRYQLQGNASGTVERCDPPKSFAATWEYGDEVTWIEVRLTPDPAGGTRFELEHVAHVDDEKWLEYGPGAVGVGWDLALLGLGAHLSSGEAVDPAAAMAWAGSTEGHTFIAASSEAWYAASVAAGTALAEARVAADRVTAFYTGAGS